MYVAVAVSNPTTSRLLKTLLADPNELVTEPVKSTSETVDVQIKLSIGKVVEMVRTQVSVKLSSIIIDFVPYCISKKY